MVKTVSLFTWGLKAETCNVSGKKLSVMKINYPIIKYDSFGVVVQAARVV